MNFESNIYNDPQLSVSKKSYDATVWYLIRFGLFHTFLLSLYCISKIQSLLLREPNDCSMRGK